MSPGHDYKLSNFYIEGFKLARVRMPTFRLARRKGEEQWVKGNVFTKINSKTKEIQRVQLFKGVAGGKSVELPRAQTEFLLQQMEEARAMGGKEGANLARQVVESALNFNKQQLYNFLAKMPDIVEGMIADAKRSNAPPELRKALRSILKKVNKMTWEQRNDFYVKYGDLFEDTTDWYLLMKKYGWKPGNFDLDPADKKKLQEKGFNSITEYYEHIMNNLNTIDSIMDDYLSEQEVKSNLRKKKARKK